MWTRPRPLQTSGTHPSQWSPLRPTLFRRGHSDAIRTCDLLGPTNAHHSHRHTDLDTNIRRHSSSPKPTSHRHCPAHMWSYLCTQVCSGQLTHRCCRKRHAEAGGGHAGPLLCPAVRTGGFLRGEFPGPAPRTVPVPALTPTHPLHKSGLVQPPPPWTHTLGVLQRSSLGALAPFKPGLPMSQKNRLGSGLLTGTTALQHRAHLSRGAWKCGVNLEGVNSQLRPASAPVVFLADGQER